MKRLFERLMILIVLFPACFWWLVNIVTRNKTEKTYLTGFIMWLLMEFRGNVAPSRKRIYP